MCHLDDIKDRLQTLGYGQCWLAQVPEDVAHPEAGGTKCKVRGTLLADEVIAGVEPQWVDDWLCATRTNRRNLSWIHGKILIFALNSPTP